MSFRTRFLDAAVRRAREGVLRLQAGAGSGALRYALTLLLGVGLAVALTHWTLVLSARRTPAEPVQAVATGNSVALTQPADLAPVVRLFGARPEDTAGNIRLLGVIATGPQGRGIALVSLDGRPARAKRAGEALAAGVTLVEVRADRVLVERSGVLQEIRVPPKAASAPSPAAPGGTRPAPVGAAQPGAANPAPIAPAGGESAEAAPAAPFGATAAPSSAARRLRGRSGP